MESKGFQTIPAEVIKAWSQGEYFVGDIPSISYRHLGNALLLRGWYTYVDDNEKRPTWAGLARIDIAGSVLSMGGVRLFGPHLVFWRTVDSYIRDDKIVWFYKGYNCAAPKTDNKIRGTYRKRDWSLDPKIPHKQFGLDKTNWKSLLTDMAINFDSDVDEAERFCPAENTDHGVLWFDVNLKKEGFRRCDYHHYRSDKKRPGRGCSNFTKVRLEDVL